MQLMINSWTDAATSVAEIHGNQYVPIHLHACSYKTIFMGNGRNLFVQHWRDIVIPEL